MFRVSDYMTKNPITVDPSERISAVLDLMRYHNIHRIPVVNSDDEIKGLITEGMIAGQDNSATSLSIYELNYLLSKTLVKTVMEKHPITIEQDALMEEATNKMLENDIGCLPVVDENKKVVGILTQNDIFKAFLEMLAFKEMGTRMIVEVEDGVGVLSHISDLFAKAGLSIRTISVYALEDGKAKILIKTAAEAPESFKQVLEDGGCQVMEWDILH